MTKRMIVASAAALLMAAAVIHPIDIEAHAVKKYVPIVDTLHVTEKEDAKAEKPDKTKDETKPIETVKKEYEDMTDPNGPLIGADKDVPQEILDKLDVELHDDPVPDDITYNGYYTVIDGKKTYVTEGN